MGVVTAFRHDIKGQVNGLEVLPCSQYNPMRDGEREQEMVLSVKELKNSFDEILRIIRLLHSIGIRPLLHTLSVIIIGTITATPCCL